LIPQMWNLERNISEFEPGSILIIISCSLKHSEKEGDKLQVICTACAGISSMP
jgi:hypothetical protein